VSNRSRAPRQTGLRACGSTRRASPCAAPAISPGTTTAPPHQHSEPRPKGVPRQIADLDIPARREQVLEQLAGHRQTQHQAHTTSTNGRSARGWPQFRCRCSGRQGDDRRQRNIGQGAGLLYRQPAVTNYELLITNHRRIGQGGWPPTLALPPSP